MTDDLVAFLAARLDEDEAAARAAMGASDGIWGIRGNISPRAASTVVTARGEFETGSPDEALHIGFHDPARVLREVEAKRRITALHHPVFEDYVDGDGIERGSYQCAEDEPPGSPDYWPCRTIRAIAAIYSDHPDYRQEWSEGTLGAHDDEP